MTALHAHGPDAGTPACGVCGWPTADPVCPCCGAASGTARPGHDAPPDPGAGLPQATDHPELAGAFAAWHAGDPRGMLAACLATFGVTSPPVSNPITGFGWAFVKDSAAIYAYFDQTNTVLSIDAPILRVPERQRVPLMRHLLELNARVVGGVRFTLRDDVVVLRWADRIGNLNPLKLVDAIGTVAGLADQADDVLALTYNAPMLGPQAQSEGLPWTYLGQPRRLRALAPAPPTGQSAAPSLGSAPPPARVVASPEANEGLTRMWNAVLRRDAMLRTDAATPGHRALILRAGLWLGWHEYSDACPGALHRMLHESRALLVAEDPDEAMVTATRDRLEKALAAKLLLTTDIRFVPSVFSEVAEARAWFDGMLRQVERGPADPLYRFPVGLGLLAELLVRAELPPDRRMWVRDSLEQARRLGPTAEGAHAALSVVERLVR